MLKNENIICISSIDWDFIWQGHQEIMANFARNGNRVLFIENTGVRTPNFKDVRRLKKRISSWISSVKGFRLVRENLYVYSPLVLPFPYSRLAVFINRYLLLLPLARWMKAVNFTDSAPIIWTFLPTLTALDIIRNIDNKLVVYYCIADFYRLVTNYKKVRKTENELLSESDVVFTQGEELSRKCIALNSNVHIFPFGVNNQFFDLALTNSNESCADIKNVSKPIIGYIGGIHRHINFNLLSKMADAHPEWSVVCVGPIQVQDKDLPKRANIYFLGGKEFSLLPCYIKEFNVCIIPYLVSEYTSTVYPTKLNEYLALGKPVVTTDLPEVIKFNRENNYLVSITYNENDFISHISSYIVERDDSEAIAARKLCAQKNNWEGRIEKMSNLMEAAIMSNTTKSRDWKLILLSSYMRKRKRVLSLAVIAALMYFSVFYTTIIWRLAEPLKISQSPVYADAIVVFGGGVGESGRSGQGYEERVNYAINLYKDGYAKNIIFSTGYKYVFNETEVMKSLAINSGVPPEAIIQEEKATNTYQNVQFVSSILRKNQWNTALLVSSPYHMRRVLLVTQKVSPDIDFVYVPFPGGFYSHEQSRRFKKINLRQIKGIIHEYGSILYYWFKGRL